MCQWQLSFFFWPLSFQGSASSSTMVVAEEMGTDLRLKRLAGDDDGHDDGDDEGGLPAYSHNDKIPPWWEYVSNDKGGNVSVSNSHQS